MRNSLVEGNGERLARAQIDPPAAVKTFGLHLHTDRSLAPYIPGPCTNLHPGRKQETSCDPPFDDTVLLLDSLRSIARLKRSFPAALQQYIIRTASRNILSLIWLMSSAVRVGASPTERTRDDAGSTVRVH
jgi:hypothetical protein